MGRDGEFEQGFYDVAVVGAGPTGLLLAGDLAAAGLRTVLLEKRDGESNLTRAFAVHARTLEHLDARGVADALVSTGQALRSLRLFGRLAVELGELPTRFPFVLITPQYETERVLERRALDAGLELRRGAEVTGLQQDAEGVTLTLADGAVVRASYAVGTDGVRSRIRELLGMPYPGESVVSSVMLGDVRLSRPPAEVLTVGANDAGFAFVAPFGDGWYRVIAWDRDDQQDDRAPVTEEELRGAVRRVLGDDHGLGEARWLSRFHSDERQVPRYRDGRVFLAGDAAHCHSPAGGQGMNTGLQDAANLGWKLAAAVKGWTPDADALLDSYDAERHPVGAMVLRTSGGLIRVALAQTRPTRLARGVATALADHLGPVTRRGGLLVSGLGISYGGVRRAPDLALAGKPGRLYEALRAGRFVLVGPGQGVADTWSDRLVRTEAAVADAPTRLVRPDGYVAWSADRPTAAEVGAALADHLGTPR